MSASLSWSRRRIPLPWVSRAPGCGEVRKQYRFDTRKGAEEYGSSVKDGFVVNYIVMDFEGKNASVEKQLWAMQALAGMWNDYEGDFPGRG